MHDFFKHYDNSNIWISWVSFCDLFFLLVFGHLVLSPGISNFFVRMPDILCEKLQG